MPHHPWSDARSAALCRRSAETISSTTFESRSIPLAPMPEQGRIVAAIEEHFSRLDAGVTALNRVAKNLKRMRAAVLQTSCACAITQVAATKRCRCRSCIYRQHGKCCAGREPVITKCLICEITDMQDGSVQRRDRATHGFRKNRRRRDSELSSWRSRLARTGATVA